MFQASSPQPTSPGSRIYTLRAVHLAELLKLKDLKERLGVQPLEFSNYEMIVSLGPSNKEGEESYLFVYNYGSVVFFNVPEDVQERELAKLIAARDNRGHDPSRTTDVFYLEVHPAEAGTVPSLLASPTTSKTTPGRPSSTKLASAPKIHFDRVSCTVLSYEVIKLSCMLLAESTALEYYEVLIQNLLEKTNVFSKKLQSKGRRLDGSEDLIKFIGLCLDTKQEIISNLYIVDSPDETWENPVLDRAHQELKGMMEIDTRYRALDYKIKIIQESLELMVDLSKSRRETVLELTIILLIAFEIVLSILKPIFAKG